MSWMSLTDGGFNPSMQRIDELGQPVYRSLASRGRLVEPPGYSVELGLRTGQITVGLECVRKLARRP